MQTNECVGVRERECVTVRFSGDVLSNHSWQITSILVQCRGHCLLLLSLPSISTPDRSSPSPPPPHLLIRTSLPPPSLSCCSPFPPSSLPRPHAPLLSPTSEPRLRGEAEGLPLISPPQHSAVPLRSPAGRLPAGAVGSLPERDGGCLCTRSDLIEGCPRIRSTRNVRESSVTPTPTRGLSANQCSIIVLIKVTKPKTSSASATPAVGQQKRLREFREPMKLPQMSANHFKGTKRPPVGLEMSFN